MVLLVATISGSGAAFFGGEALVGLAAVVVSSIQFRRGWRYTGVGLMGGWIAGLLIVALIQALG